MSHASTAFTSAARRLRSAHDRYEESPSPETGRAYADAWDTYGLRTVQLASTRQGELKVRGWAEDANRTGDEAVSARYQAALEGGLALREANRSYRKAVRVGPRAQARAAAARSLVLVQHGFRGDARSWETDDGQVEAAVGAVIVEKDQKWSDRNGNQWVAPAGAYEVTLTEQVSGQQGTVRGVGHRVDGNGSTSGEFEIPLGNLGSARDGDSALGGVFVQYRGVKPVGRGQERRFEYPDPPVSVSAVAS